MSSAVVSKGQRFQDKHQAGSFPQKSEYHDI